MADASATDKASEVLAQCDAWSEGRKAMGARAGNPSDAGYPSHKEWEDSDATGLQLVVEIAEVLRALLHREA
jgi:hypothetical protein